MQYSCYISNEGILEECHNGENVAVKWGCYCFLFQKKTKKSFHVQFLGTRAKGWLACSAMT